eukprot:Rhum_TRINITY_DN14638_c23_g1::Rhum_TRINITY_DN14638_c23_g1_i1::g.105657::m.105657
MSVMVAAWGVPYLFQLAIVLLMLIGDSGTASSSDRSGCVDAAPVSVGDEDRDTGRGDGAKPSAASSVVQGRGRGGSSSGGGGGAKASQHRASPASSDSSSSSTESSSDDAAAASSSSPTANPSATDPSAPPLQVSPNVVRFPATELCRSSTRIVYLSDLILSAAAKRDRGRKKKPRRGAAASSPRGKSGKPELPPFEIFQITTYSPFKARMVEERAGADGGATVHVALGGVYMGETEATLQIVFQPESVEAVSANVTVHTSLGDLVYLLEGEGLPSPYRVAPLVGMVVPVGSSYRKTVSLYNPSPTDSLVVENVTTSNAFIRLHHSASLRHRWTVAPLQSQQLAVATLLPLVPGTLDGSVRVVFTGVGADGRAVGTVTLDIPVGCLSVTSSVRPTRTSIDFGLVSDAAGEAQARISLLNTLQGAEAGMDAEVASVHLTREGDGEADTEGAFSFPDPELRILATLIPQGGVADVVEVALRAPPAAAAAGAAAPGVVRTRGLITLQVAAGGRRETRLAIPYTATYIRGRLRYKDSGTLFPSSALSGLPLTRSSAEEGGEGAAAAAAAAAPSAQPLVVQNLY